MWVAIVFFLNPRFQTAFPSPLFPPLLSGMISLRASSLKSVPYPLFNSLTIAEATSIGESLSACLKACKTGQQGLEMWKVEYPSMQDLCKAHPAFASLTLAIAKKKIMVAPWGMFLRVWTGAFLSLLDMTTDIITIVGFLNQGRTTFAYASIAMISFAIAIQLLVVYAQRRKRGARILAREWLVVFSLLKPAVDAYRVVGGEMPDDDDVASPFDEMIITKIAEM